jgi:hypothetical protein
MIFLGRGPRIWRGQASLSLCAALCAAKVTGAEDSHVFGPYRRQRSKPFDSRYMDDTDKVPQEGFPMRKLMQQSDGKEAKGDEARLLEWRARLTDARITYKGSRVANEPGGDAD